MAERADLVILGGGLAGLALASRLARNGAGGRVRIIEPRLRYVDDRSWAFWTPVDSPWAATATRTWAHWRCAGSGGGVTASAAGWRYAYLRSSDVYAEAIDAIATDRRITLELGVHAGALRATATGVEVATSAGVIAARHAVDTRPPGAGRWNAAPMFQCFAGHELAIDGPGIDDRAVELMTDMRADALGFVFSYVLPLTPTRVLVEATRFATRPLGADVLAADLDALVAARGWARATVLRTERAVLPMGLPRAPADAAPRGVVLAGTAGGALRAASGYGFLRIQAWASRCAAALADNGRPLGHPDDPALRRWMDAVFLRALARHPARAPEFFLRLARDVPAGTFVRFLSDRASATDLARIVAALPAGPFLRALGPRQRIEQPTA